MSSFASEYIKKIFDNLKIIHTDNPRWKNELRNEIGEFIPETTRPYNAILNMEEKMASSIVIEREYVDQDYLDTFSCFYCRLFESSSPKTIRLHFFKEKITYPDLMDLSGKEYLGYSVIRPIRSCRTGRTVLKSPLDNGNTQYTLCKTEFSVNLSGSQLYVCGMPFIQQDTNVTVCAESSLWMAALYMHQKYKFARFTPSDITKLATKYVTVGPPRTGLTVTQMVSALREMGYQPVRFVNHSKSETIQIIYSYIESEIPVLVTLKSPTTNKAHVITIIGHDYNFRISTPIKSNVNMIKNFYFHDDAFGPYKKINIDNGAKIKLGRKSLKYFLDPPPTCFKPQKNVEKMFAQYLLVPLPEEITLQAEDILRHIKALFSIQFFNPVLLALRQKCPRIPKEILFLPEELENIVIRVYLQSSNEFKTSLPNGMSERFKLIYRAMRLPKYIWVVELSTREALSKPKANDRTRLGEIIIDSTADRHALLDSCIALHFRGRMITRLGIIDFDPREGPYPIRVRTPGKKKKT